MKTIIIILMLSCGTAFAETKIYSNGLNLPAGHSYQVGNTTLYQDSLNLPFASKVNLGSISVFADAYNLPIGASVNAGPNVLSMDYNPVYELKGLNYEPF